MFFAEKIISKKTLEECNMLDQAVNEIKICSFVNHPNIIQTFGCNYDNNHIYLIQEYADGGDLYGLLS